ncbi:PREDICTED: uncharacterized protein LOC105316269 [Amphimedon queenslandica]|uniref:DNA 3'-5' helicase n=2 Tax=Amphimedon queenslandica TaxID=400682 RepID=A0AAN0IUJ6_AMPQE|nr:PREDICTED: uncharacterized protein LOC105316269 [Amphimedon queenslandica]|eukprot:XP_011409396.1 PREDICTED: uncharacterized protein LOC105316269 [Amphimedon queenslandica]
MAAVSRRVIDDAIKARTLSLGYQKLKKDQARVIRSFVEGNDIFACLPTGFGKSLCYFSLPVIFDLLHERSSPTSAIIVISPLQALMMDQVVSLKNKGIKAVTVIDLGDDDDERNLLEKSESVEEESKSQYLLDKVIQFLTEIVKTIICRTYNDCSRIYQLFKFNLRRNLQILLDIQTCHNFDLWTCSMPPTQSK